MVDIDQSNLIQVFSPLAFVLLSGIQMDSHCLIILLGKPFYGKCLHYLITAHRSLSILCASSWNLSWEHQVSWTHEPESSDSSNAAGLCLQSYKHIANVLSYAAMVTFMFGTWPRACITAPWIPCIFHDGLKGNQPVALLYIWGDFKRTSCLSGDALCQPGLVSILHPLPTAKQLPAGSSCSRHLRNHSELLSLRLPKGSPCSSFRDRCRYSGTPSDRSEWSEP